MMFVILSLAGCAGRYQRPATVDRSVMGNDAWWWGVNLRYEPGSLGTLLRAPAVLG